MPSSLRRSRARSAENLFTTTPLSLSTADLVVDSATADASVVVSPSAPPTRRARRRATHEHETHHARERMLGFGIALVAGLVLAGNGVAAMGSVLPEEQRAAAQPRPQSFAVSAEAQATVAGRDDFSVTWTPPVVYPLGPGAQQTDGFGYRIAPCSSCSSDHHGVDWTPGSGTPVASIADGVVTAVGHDGTFGMRVEIEHVIDGQVIRTLSAHLQSNSVPVRLGETVEVGQIIGAVGSTGQSTGAHLHFEVHVGGTPIDPVAWLATNARTEPR